jgi:hypothetical protein
MISLTSSDVGSSLSWRGLTQRRGQEPRRALGPRDREHLRNLLSNADVESRYEGEGDRHRDPDRDAVREGAEDRLDQRRDSGLAEKADADRGHRDPDLARRQVLVDTVEFLESDPRATAALLC